MEACLVCELHLDNEFPPKRIGDVCTENARLSSGHGREKVRAFDGHALHTVGSIWIQNGVQQRHQCHCMLGHAKYLVKGCVVCDVGKLHRAHNFRGKDKAFSPCTYGFVGGQSLSI